MDRFDIGRADRAQLAPVAPDLGFYLACRKNGITYAALPRDERRAYVNGAGQATHYLCAQCSDADALATVWARVKVPTVPTSCAIAPFGVTGSLQSREALLEEPGPGERTPDEPRSHTLDAAVEQNTADLGFFIACESGSIATNYAQMDATAREIYSNGLARMFLLSLGTSMLTAHQIALVCDNVGLGAPEPAPAAATTAATTATTTTTAAAPVSAEASGDKRKSETPAMAVRKAQRELHEAEKGRSLGPTFEELYAEKRRRFAAAAFPNATFAPRIMEPLPDAVPTLLDKHDLGLTTRQDYILLHKRQMAGVVAGSRVAKTGAAAPKDGVSQETPGAAAARAAAAERMIVETTTPTTTAAASSKPVSSAVATSTSASTPAPLPMHAPMPAPIAPTPLAESSASCGTGARSECVESGVPKTPVVL